MTIINLGVYDMPYAAQIARRPKVAKPSGRRPRTRAAAMAGYGTGKTTGDIAEIIESKYGLMQTFFNLERQMFVTSLEKAVKGAIHNIMLGQPTPIDLGAEAMEKIKARFKSNLSQRRYDGVISGVPTKAALAGVSHRFMKPYGKRGERPSFIDTGTLQSSFTAWQGK
jgi:hypothetical protein